MLHSYACPDCGANPINHRVARSSARAELFLDKLFAPLESLRRGLEILIAKARLELLLLPLIEILSLLHLATKVRHVVTTDSYRTRVLFDSAGKRHIEMYHVFVLGRPTSLFVAKHNGQTVVYTHEPRPIGPPSSSYDWMDNKSVIINRFAQAGIPVPKGGACKTPEQALEIFHKVGTPVVTKPVIGSRSRHTYTHLNSDQQVLHGFAVAQQISPWVIVEQELQGMVYRATVIGGQVIGVLRREPAHVVGDGQKTVKQLIVKENKNPLRHGPIFHPLLMDLEAKSELKQQGLTFDSIPKSGQMVVLNFKVGRGEGASNADVTDETHPENIKLFQKIGEFLADPLVGIDFIIEDITRPWQEQKACGVIECNAMPFIDLHHYPLTGKPRDAAGALWDIVFPETSSLSPR